MQSRAARTESGSASNAEKGGAARDAISDETLSVIPALRELVAV